MNNAIYIKHYDTGDRSTACCSRGPSKAAQEPFSSPSTSRRGPSMWIVSISLILVPRAGSYHWRPHTEINLLIIIITPTHVPSFVTTTSSREQRVRPLVVHVVTVITTENVFGTTEPRRPLRSGAPLDPALCRCCIL